MGSTSSLCSGNLHSHPDCLLADHLQQTMHIALQNLTELPMDTDEGLTLTVRLSAICHDLGKSTDYFQQYLFASKRQQEQLSGKAHTQHSLLSATAAYYMVQQAVLKVSNAKYKKWLPFIAYMAVRRHHGNLRLAKIETQLRERDIKMMQQQIVSIDRVKWNALMCQLKSAGLCDTINLEQWSKWVAHFPTELGKCRRLWRSLKRHQDVGLYVVMNLVFSLLIDADKSAVVVGDNVSRTITNFSRKLVDNYKQQINFPTSPLNELRERAYQDALKKPNIDVRLYDLTLPTGLGKTFTALSFAFELRKRIFNQSNHQARIIYSLPFLSVIEQNADQIEAIFEKNNIDINTNLLLKQHHLSDVYYKDEQGEFEPAQAKLLIEGWNSELIVTTFVQLFHTLAGYRNSSLRKFHRLVGSILILDEVQTIPAQYWPLVRAILSYLAEHCKTYVILVTATQPQIFTKNESFPLVNRQEYFAGLDRVVLIPDVNQPMLIEDFSSSLLMDSKKSYLFVFNTIKAARQFYALLQQQFPDENIVYLSTHVVPSERLKRIRSLSSSQARLCVSTQLIEAGVDIDFDIVYRDLAPLDSINQTAGRCNRHGNSQGEVRVVWLKDENRPYASYVYDITLLELTQELLTKNKHIPEAQFLELIETYYTLVNHRTSQDKSKQLLEAIHMLNYDSDEGLPLSTFKLIEQDYLKLDIFVEIDEHAAIVWRRYIEICDMSDKFARKLAFAEIKAKFYNYTLSVPAVVANRAPILHNIGYVNNFSLDDYYDRETGYKCDLEVAIW